MRRLVDGVTVWEGLRAVLVALADFEFVGTAASGREAVSVAAECRPDVIVMDLHMPELDGVQATSAVLAEHSEVAVLILTMYDDDEMLVAALQAGARGYLLKGASHADIAQALRTVATGGAVFGTGVADLVLGRWLYLSPKTVRNHVSNILAKLGVADRAQAIAVARDAGLGPPAVGS